MLDLIKQIINLESDTFTLPTDEMRKAMYESVVGDDVYEEDPTVNKLEKLAAEIVGKEAALFVPSGTMGNLIAMMVHCNRGEEVIVESEAHIYYYEVGSIGSVAGLTPRFVKGEDGIITCKDVESALREEDIHYPNTGLICLESPHNRGGGTVMPLETMDEIYKLAKERKLKVHLDGSRIFNAAHFLQVDVSEITSKVDSLMFCLSKGLSAPVGSMLCGTNEFIEKSRKIRKLVGGGMRQAGVIAAPAIVALNTMIERLKDDNKNAKDLAKGLSSIPGIKIDLDKVHTNILIFDISDLKVTSKEFRDKLYNNYKIRLSIHSPNTLRMVTHRHIDEKDVDYVISSIKEFARGIR